MNGDTKQQLPGWFYLVRSSATTLVGLVLLLVEGLGDGPSSALLLVAALLLVGIAPADLWGFVRGRGNSADT